MGYHVRVSSEPSNEPGPSAREAFAFHIDEAELQRRFIRPWHERQEVICGGLAFPADSVRLQILRDTNYAHSSYADAEDWMRVRSSASVSDVTDEYLAGRRSEQPREVRNEQAGSTTYNTQVIGPGAMVTVGSNAVQHAMQIVQRDDRASLRAAMREVGVTEPWIAELEQALEADSAVALPDGEPVGENTRRWLDRAGAAVRAGRLPVAAGVTSGVLLDLIRAVVGGG